MDDRFEVWPENWESVAVFAACWDQWSIVSVGMGGVWYEGLDNAKVQATMTMMNVKDKKQVLDDLRVMVAEARVERNKRANETP